MFRVPVFALRVTQGGKKQHETEARWSRGLCLGKSEDYGTPLGERCGFETTRAMRRHKTATLLKEIAQSTKQKQQVNKVAH